MYEFDVLLEEIGVVGTAQIVIFLLISYFNISSGINAVATVFIAYSPAARCNVPPLDNGTLYPNLTENDILNYTTPYDASKDQYDECSRYSYNLSSCNGNDLSCVNTSYPAMSCDNGYHFDRSILEETVITEYEIICDRAYLSALSTSMFYVGMLLGSLIFGNFADAFGRKLTALLTFVGVIGCMFGVSYSTSIEMYMVFRVATATFSYGTVIGTFVYVTEIVGKTWRTFFGIAYQISFSVGYMILSGLAYNWRNWHDTMLVATLISSPFLIFAAILPESPRWLFIKNRNKEGKKVTMRMAKMNKVTISDEVWKRAEISSIAKQENDEIDRKYSTFDLFRLPRTRLVTLNVMFNWFVNSLVYYGVSLNAGALAGDLFLNNTLNGVMEIVSYVLCILLLDRLGRRWVLSGMLVGGGVALLISLTLIEFANGSQTMETVSVVFAFIGKIGISGSFSVIYNLTSELYPTVTRSNGVGLGSAAARIGGISAPFIISIQDYVRWLPNTIFGVLGVAAGLLSLFFPETNNCEMMQTLEEAEEFYKTGKQRLLTRDGEVKSDSGNLKEKHEVHVNKSFEAEATQL